MGAGISRSPGTRSRQESKALIASLGVWPLPLMLRSPDSKWGFLGKRVINAFEKSFLSICKGSRGLDGVTIGMSYKVNRPFRQGNYNLDCKRVKIKAL